MYESTAHMPMFCASGIHFNNWIGHYAIKLRIKWRERASIKLLLYRNSLSRSIRPPAFAYLPYDPFKENVYQLGNVFLDIIQYYQGLKPFLNLGNAMTRKDPKNE
ncbi:hypothetical protein Hypma_002479 [Hypsizygus marmoreus]|uniref:Uncharacterized protein n=1 Tax=Hypsizygus marmoreus TaxID=39966 RepID=A0A369JCV0_HYPMA|nr:hypothetical protein Hypma_002479 [Hypsizygus marmoreus]